MNAELNVNEGGTIILLGFAIYFIKLYLPWILVGVLLVYAALFPVELEKFSALIWKILSKIFKAIPFFQKKYIQHDFQSRANSFVNNFLAREIKDFQPIKIKVDWVENGEIPASFRDGGKLIVRMRQDDNKNWNFVHASMVFLSECVLIKAKRYISKKQKESIDLFVGKKMFEKEKEEVVEQFIENFLHPKIEDKKIDSLFVQYLKIDRSGLFFPVFIQEMSFLGGKVFNSRKDSKIITEVSDLIIFLKNYSKRKLGQEIENQFLGNYCKFGIIIVGKGEKILTEGANPYKNCIKKFNGSGVETLYIIADQSRKEFVKESVCNEALCKEIDFRLYNEKEYPSYVCYGNKCNKKKVSNYLLVMRKNKIEHYYLEDK